MRGLWLGKTRIEAPPPAGFYPISPGLDNRPHVQWVRATPVHVAMSVRQEQTLEFLDAEGNFEEARKSSTLI